MASSKLFGGANLSDIARSVNERAEPSPLDRPAAARPVLAAAEMATHGAHRARPLERENIFAVDPRRVRPWKYHNRTSAWYTRERCLDLIESIAKDGQQEPALARKLSGDPNFDYELIYGMRRRFACEYLNAKLKLRVLDADDARAAVLMHIENADRQDITPMERALSFHSPDRGQAVSHPGGAGRGDRPVEGAGGQDDQGGRTDARELHRGACFRTRAWCRWIRPTSSRR